MRGVVFSLLFLVAGCTNLFYQPTKLVYFEPQATIGIEPEDIRFESRDKVLLHGWLLKAKDPGPDRILIVQFHGNAENLTSHFASLAWVINQGYDLFIFDYRGYGRSNGSPFPQGVQLDGLAALDKAREIAGARPRSIVVYGQSLGGAIALSTTEEWEHREELRAIVIEGGFLSYKRIARDKLSDHWLTWPFQWISYLLVSNSYGPTEKLAAISPTPLLVLHSTQDPVVPFHHGEAIFKTAKDPKCFWPIAERGHNNLMNVQKGKYRASMLRFFENQTCP